MRRLSNLVFVTGTIALTLAATSASGQQVTSAGRPNRGLEVTRSPAAFGIDATTPSRIASSRREMNRGLRGGDGGFRMDMTPLQTREYAERVIRRGGFICDVVDAAVVARSDASAPLVEVSCGGGGGLVVADTTPLQWTDCLNIPAEGIAVTRNSTLPACRLPGNVTPNGS